jgi:solute carrier family 25 protein 46
MSFSIPSKRSGRIRRKCLKQNSDIFFSCCRRQAQIQGDSSRAYLTPLSAIRMVYTMKYQQGSGVLWKGCFSSLILTTAESLSNNLIDEIAPFTDSASILKHVTLKTISSFLLIPIYSVHLLRSVQSDLTIISNWSPLNIFIEPFQRMLGIKASSYARALPLWQLISLSLPYFVGRHVIQYLLNRRLVQLAQNSSVPRTSSTIDQLETIDDIECQLVDTIPSLVNRSFVHVEASIISVFLSQFILYPYETVLNRLFVQGTRTIVDNLDKTGIGCVPINTRYLGFIDCCRTISEVEGGWARGFYKGIGFLILKFGLIYASAHCLKVLAERLAIIYTQNTSEISKFHHYIASNQQQQHETESN